MAKRKCCGSCVWHQVADGEWRCDNEESKNCGLETDFCDSCDEYERK